MNIAGEIKKEIQKELREGATQEELAAKYKVTQSHIYRIISGKCSVSFETLERMFPNATIHLHGDPVVASNSGINHGNVIGVNNGQIHSSSVENFRDRAIRAVLDLDLPPEHSMTVLKTLKNLEAKA